MNVDGPVPCALLLWGSGRSYICRIVMISGRLTIMTASGFVVISYLAGMIHDTRTTRGTDIKSFPSLILLLLYVKTQNSKILWIDHTNASTS